MAVLMFFPLALAAVLHQMKWHNETIMIILFVVMHHLFQPPETNLFLSQCRYKNVALQYVPLHAPQAKVVGVTTHESCTTKFN